MSFVDKLKEMVGLKPAEPVAKTAGEQDHSDPWVFAGEDADPPVNPKEDDR